MKFARTVFISWVFLFLYNIAYAQQLMTLEEVERLIEASPNKEIGAYFHSVERGTQLKSYDVILRGVLKEPGFNVIMFVSRGEIVAGMSGSPVYIDGKLIGALAYGFNELALSNWWWGGIQPIHSMIRQSEAGQQRLLASRNFSYQGKEFKPISTGNRFIPGLESFGEVIVSSSLQSGSSSKPTLRAGMPIVVDLIEWTDEKGEVSTVSGMGTITYIDKGGKIYAFGHPYLDSRNVVYSFRTAEVMGTVYSELRSFKLTGKTSEVLGAITYDASYGISGSVLPDELKKLNHFNLEFKNEGKLFHSFNIRVANSIMTPTLAQAAFNMIGEIYGAPLPQEMSVTQLDSRVELEGHPPILWKELFSSTSSRFGVQTFFTSSYRAAHETFFARIYSYFFQNNYGLKISDVAISVNFIPGRSQTYKLGAYKFPSKVIYGQDPVLEILLVDESNSMPIAKKLTVKIDWSRIEKPVYTKNTLDTEKVGEKRVTGSLGIYSAPWFFNLIDQNGGAEKQKLNPEYFLGVDDFLENFSRLLQATNQKIFIRVSMKSKSGLFDEKIAKAEDLIPQGIPNNGNSGWYVIDGGLRTRAQSLVDGGSEVFYPELPQIPDGYVIDRNLHDGLFFEVVNE